jgi:predicted acyl esterase
MMTSTRIDRNKNTGNQISGDAAGISAMQTVYPQKKYSSQIELPLINEA